MDLQINQLTGSIALLRQRAAKTTWSALTTDTVRIILAGEIQ